MSSQYGIIGRTGGSGPVTSFCCSTISCKCLADIAFLIHILTSIGLVALNMLKGTTALIDFARLIYIIILIFGVVSIRSRMFFPIVVSAVIMTVWAFVFCSLSVVVFVFTLYSFFKYKDAVLMVMNVTEWMGVQFVGEFFEANGNRVFIGGCILCFFVLFWLSYQHDKVADALLSIWKYRANRVPMIPVTRGELIRLINGETADTTATTKRPSPSVSRTPASAANNNDDKFVSVPLYPRLN